MRAVGVLVTIGIVPLLLFAMQDEIPSWLPWVALVACILLATTLVVMGMGKKKRNGAKTNNG